MASPALRFGPWSQTGNVYAITAVTRARRPWFDDKANVDLLIEALRTVERTGRTSSLAWVVMPDHTCIGWSSCVPERWPAACRS